MRVLSIFAVAAMTAASALPLPAAASAPSNAAAGLSGPQARGGRPDSQERGGQVAEAGPRPYDSVVTAEAVSRSGLFTVHRIDSKLLFEIPEDQFGKDLLLVTEIAKTVLGSGYGGQAVGNRVLQWELREDRVYLRTVSYSAVADPETPEYLAVQNANVAPIVAGFDVEAYAPDRAAVIDVSDLFTSPPSELGPGNRIPGNVDSDRSWIDRATPFPDNVNVYATLTFAQQAGGRAAAAPATGRRGNTNTNPSNTIQMSWSFHRLPDEPMMPRLCDDRVGYFSQTLTDYTDDDQQVQQKCFISRYRLEKQDPEADISDPVEPIVYYIDPATPKKWIPWFKKGIEDWQPAFEAAGFSNAIIAREAPDDPDWSPEDARYSVVRWLPSTTENASGPHVHDPRSGEILNAHIQFYQNVQRLLLSWYFTQASAVDARARSFPFPDDLMGRLLEYVLAHEVGHTLGFPHNFKSSSLYPVDSLRSPSFLAEWGHVPSIMDYSRFNYLAQPEDNIPVDLLTPGIGPYDIYATMWGYKPIPSARTPEEERATLDEWAREQDTKPWLRFNTSGSAGSDPGEESEAVGDADAVKATGWGLANIKREVQYLLPATRKPMEGWDDLDMLYGRLIGQWRTELGHVANIVGGTDSREQYGNQDELRFTPIRRDRQKRAVAFLVENAFPTPTFFLVDELLRRIEPSGNVARITSAQGSILNSILRDARLLRLSEHASGARPGTAYTPMELLSDVRSGLFSELASNQEIDVYRRTLQRMYVEALDTKINPPPPEASSSQPARRGPTRPQLDPKLSDIYAVVRAELRALGDDIQHAAEGAQGLRKAHLEDLYHRIELALEGKGLDLE
jgi:hypothetical protein